MFVQCQNTLVRFQLAIGSIAGTLAVINNYTQVGYKRLTWTKDKGVFEIISQLCLQINTGKSIHLICFEIEMNCHFVTKSEINAIM